MLLVQENHVSEENSSSAEEVNGGEVYNPPDNDGELLTVEEEVPVAEVVDEVQDHSQMVVESNVKIEEVPKKSYAAIVSGHEMFLDLNLFLADFIWYLCGY